MTNDRLKAAIRAHMAEHGVNYTTARRAVTNPAAATASTSTTPSWHYHRHTFTDPEVARAVARANRKPRIRPEMWVDPYDTGWDGDPWEPAAIRDFPFLANIHPDDDRPHLRYYDPYEAHQDALQHEAGELAAQRAEAAGTPFPPADTWEGRTQRLIEGGYEREENPLLSLGEDWEYGHLTLGGALNETERYLKQWPGSIRGWDMLGHLYYEAAYSKQWTPPIPAEDRAYYATESRRAYETGVAIGERAMPKTVNAPLIIWGWLENRPFLRCLQNLCDIYHREGRTDEAITIATDLLWLNPNDNQGIRYTLSALLDHEPDDDNDDYY